MLRLKNPDDIKAVDFNLESNINFEANNELDTTFTNIYYVNTEKRINTSNIKEATRPEAFDSVGVFSDPKFLNSDICYGKFYYDTFGYIIKPEFYSRLNDLMNGISDVTYKITSTVNSKFLFKFTSPNDIQIEDYEGYTIVSRNNELPIYSDTYYNYIKTGYNYDMKNKQLSAEYNNITAGASMIKGLGSVAVGAASGRRGASSIAVGIEQLVSAGATLMQNEVEQQKIQNSINQKIAESKYQSTSVIGGDDYDLMNEYCENSLRFSFYMPYPFVLDKISNIFHYYGYACNDIESFNLNSECVYSRYHFNFIQADIEFEYCLMSSEMKEDLVNRFKNGVTFLHGYDATGGAVEFDFTQQYENYELSIVNYTGE